MAMRRPFQNGQKQKSKGCKQRFKNSRFKCTYGKASVWHANINGHIKRRYSDTPLIWRIYIIKVLFL